MAIRLLVPLIIGFALILYLTFLNPVHVKFSWLPGSYVELPLVILLLFAAFAGAITLGLFYFLAGMESMWEGVKDAFRKRRKAAAEKLMVTARDKAREGNNRAALKNAEKALKRDPKNLDALLLKGHALRSEGRIKEALDTHSLALAYHPLEKSVLMQIKDDYLSAGHLDAAYKVLGRALGRSPRDAAIIYEMSRIAERQGDLERATLLQKESLKHIRDPREVGIARQRLGELYCRYAERLIKQNATRKAMDELARSLKLIPDFLPAVFLQVKAVLKDGNPAEADRILRSEFKRSRSMAVLQELVRLEREKSGNGIAAWMWARKQLEGSPRQLEVLVPMAAEQIVADDYPGAEGTLNLAGEKLLDNGVYNLARGVIELAERNPGSGALPLLKKGLEQETADLFRYLCDHCGEEGNGWFSVCPRCGEWNTARLRSRI